LSWDWTNLAQIKFRSTQSAHGTATTAHGNNNYRTHLYTPQPAWIPPQPNPALPILTRRRRAACDGESFYARWPATGRDEPRGGSGLRVECNRDGLGEKGLRAGAPSMCLCPVRMLFFLPTPPPPPPCSTPPTAAAASCSTPSAESQQC
jgi:hypothetical protein